MKFLLLITMLFFSNFATASAVDEASVIQVLSGKVYGSVVFVKISPSPSSGMPSCQTDQNYSYAFDPTTDIGKVTLSMVLAAYASGKKVYINGYSSCDLYNGVQDLRQIRLQ